MKTGSVSKTDTATEGLPLDEANRKRLGAPGQKGGTFQWPQNPTLRSSIRFQPSNGTPQGETNSWAFIVNQILRCEEDASSSKAQGKERLVEK